LKFKLKKPERERTRERENQREPERERERERDHGRCWLDSWGQAWPWVQRQRVPIQKILFLFSSYL